MVNSLGYSNADTLNADLYNSNEQDYYVRYDHKTESYDLNDFFKKNQDLLKLYSDSDNAEQFVSEAISSYREAGKAGHYERVKCLENIICHDVPEKYQFDIVNIVRNLYIEKRAEIIYKSLNLSKKIDINVLQESFKEGLIKFFKGSAGPDRAEGYSNDIQGIYQAMTHPGLNVAEIEKKGNAEIRLYLDEYIQDKLLSNSQCSNIMQEIAGIPGLKDSILDAIIRNLFGLKKSNRMHRLQEVRSSAEVQDAIAKAIKRMEARREKSKEAVEKHRKQIAANLSLKNKDLFSQQQEVEVSRNDAISHKKNQFFVKKLSGRKSKK